jgi:hypothetical protein
MSNVDVGVRGRCGMEPLSGLARTLSRGKESWSDERVETMVETMGLEPTTPCVQSRCSSH